MSRIVDSRFEIDTQRTVIDPRSIWKKGWDGLAHPRILPGWAIASTALILLSPATIAPCAVVFFILWLALILPKDVLPIHLPLAANKPDLNDPKPGLNNGYYKARGSFYAGRLLKGGIEVWMSFKTLTQHWWLLGTTGAGKTERIVSWVVNFLAVGSAVAFQDAKAAPRAMIQMATHCRIFGRDLDFRVTNYITGLQEGTGDPAERRSNDAAIFSKGSAESKTQLLVSLMPPSQGDNKLFQERAIALVASIMPALTDLSMLGRIQIDPGVVRDYLAFNKFVELFTDNHIGKRSRDALKAYLESLAGYDRKKPVNQQPDEVTRQFGFAQAYFTRSLASLSDTYGHIYLVGQGEIEYQDAVLNGRILLTLLPSMEKSGEELANLGKIVQTAARNGMVVGLGTVFEGSVNDIVHRLPTNSEIPYGIANDENAYMVAEGQEMANAQGRGLGFAILTGTQDLPGMLEREKKTTLQIIANSATKEFMYLDDEETTEFAIKMAGKARFIARSQYERYGDLGNIYATGKGNLEERDRLTRTALQAQEMAQAMMLYKGKLRETQVFNHGIADKHKDPLYRYLDDWFMMRLAKVKIPTEDEMAYLMKHSPRREWEDLALMLRDDARHMLREMNLYFSSQLTIRRIAEHYIADAEMTALLGPNLVANELLTDVIEPAEGLLAIATEQSIRNTRDTLAVFAAIARLSRSGEVAVAKLGDLAGLDAFAMDPDPVSRGDQSAEESYQAGRSGGGGGSQKATPMPAEEEDILAAFLDTPDPWPVEAAGSPAPAAPIGYETETSFIEPEHRAAPQPARPMSDVAMAVAANLENMPWMATAIEYGEVRQTFLQAETLFNGGDERLAAEVADREMAALSKALVYPQTQLQPKSKAMDVLKGLLE